MRSAAALLICLLASSAAGQTFDNLDAQLCYVEPTTSGGSPLDDLQGCTVQGRGQGQTIVASSPNGGGTVCTTPRSVVGSVEGSVDFQATCADLLGNVSVGSNVVTRTFPGIAPDPPTLLP